MAKIRKLEHHGRETYAVYYGPGHVLKRPLPTFSEETQQEWLKKQHRTQPIIQEIADIKNPAYNIPLMIHINDDEIQILEERAPGYHLTKELYRSVSKRQKYEIRYGISSFLVDMNELREAEPVTLHNISSELKFARLENFVENKMENWFNINEVRYMIRLKNEFKNFEYETRRVWSHGDLNSGNVLYDPETSVLSFIDFAESDYKFVYRDIFAPLQIELDICKNVYEGYSKLHDKSKYLLPGVQNPKLQEIMKYRMLCVNLRRFIKSADDLRLSPQNEKSVKNNIEKIAFMREMMKSFLEIERKFSK